MRSLIHASAAESNSHAPQLLRDFPPYFDEPPPSSVSSGTLFGTAIAADMDPCKGCNLVDLWKQFAQGGLRHVRARRIQDRWYVAARVRPSEGGPGVTPTPSEAAVLIRVLCGEQQKAVASELSLATSTASRRFVTALHKLGVENAPVPVPLIVAAQRWFGIAGARGARGSRFADSGTDCIGISVPLPDLTRLSVLTQTERDVALLFIEGFSRRQIAQWRGTSTNTVARQIHSIFDSLSLLGRHALIRRASELGCFD